MKPSNAIDLKPADGRSNKDAPAMPFMERFTIKRGEASTYQGFDNKEHISYPTYTIYDGDLPIASYDGDHLVVLKQYRRQGIATALVKDYRSRNISVPIAETRTPASQKVQEKAYQQIIDEAIKDSQLIPENVLADIRRR